MNYHQIIRLFQYIKYLLFLSKYDKDIVSRYTVPFPLAYKTIKLTHESRAEDALKFFINKVNRTTTYIFVVVFIYY